MKRKYKKQKWKTTKKHKSKKIQKNMQNLKVAHVFKLQYPGTLEIADSSTLAAQPPSLQC